MPRSPPEISTHRTAAGSGCCGASGTAGVSGTSAASGGTGSAAGFRPSSGTTMVGSSSGAGVGGSGFSGSASSAGALGSSTGAGSSSDRLNVSSNSSSYKSQPSCRLFSAGAKGHSGRRNCRPTLPRTSLCSSLPVKSGPAACLWTIACGFDKFPLNNIAQFLEKRKWEPNDFSRSSHFF